MKKIIRTKSFSATQSLNIVRNLHQKFKAYSAIELSFDCYSNGMVQVKYSLYVADICSERLDIWSDLLDKYEELMKEN